MRKVFIQRARCGGCGVTHALLPAFVLAWRLDAAETAGLVIARAAGGECGVRPAAGAAGVPFTTARGWVRRFTARAGELAVGFSALGRSWAVSAAAAGAGPVPVRGRGDQGGVHGGGGAAGLAALGRWRFASAVTGGSLIAANASSPFLIIGRRRFMPPRSP